MIARLPATTINRATFANDVLRASEAEVARLPMQWRCLLLDHRRRREYPIQRVIAMLDSGEVRDQFDPQAVFDACNGRVPT